MNSVMISVNPPYTDLFRSGEKLIEFRKQILNETIRPLEQKPDR